MLCVGSEKALVIAGNATLTEKSRGLWVGSHKSNFFSLNHNCCEQHHISHSAGFLSLRHTRAMQNDEGQSSQSIHHIVYCSQAAQHMDKEALEKIIATAKRHNPRFGITGLLVFGSGIFFQWLEGPRDNVTSLFKMISADTRHFDVVLLTKEDEFRERLFPNWDMELVAAEDISAVLEDAMHEASDPKQKSTLSQMLQELHKNSLVK
jgi:hypothetical protein